MFGIAHSIMNSRAVKRLTWLIWGTESLVRGQGSILDPASQSAAESQPFLDGTSTNMIERNLNQSIQEHMAGSPDCQQNVPHDQLVTVLKDENIPAGEAPPLNSRYMEIITYVGPYGEKCSALTLTRNVVWQLNLVMRCEETIAGLLEQLSVNQSQIEEVIGVLNDLRQDLRSMEGDKYNEQLGHIKEADDIILELERQRQSLEESLSETREELEQPRQRMFRDMKEALGDNNLIETPSEDHVPWNVAGKRHRAALEQLLWEPKVLTSSETAHQQAFELKHAAEEDFKEKTFIMQDARDRVHNWKQYHDTEWQEFSAMKERGEIDTSKTDFDVIMIQEAQKATAELIEAEKNLDEARERAKLLGVVLDAYDQESGFVDRHDDGYAESMEAEIIATVDRGRIERWMATEKENVEAEVDDWECGTVDVHDSVSMVDQQVATGSERRRIDRWRSMCELLQVEIVANEGQEE